MANLFKEGQDTVKPSMAVQNTLIAIMQFGMNQRAKNAPNAVNYWLKNS